MNLEIDFRSGIPIYLQVVEQIKERIASGQLLPGTQLPTVRSLALELRVNFNTIARSYRILDETGIISTQQGRGTYVMSIPLPEVSEKIRQEALQALTLRYLADTERLGASPEEVHQLINAKLVFWQQTGRLPDLAPDHEIKGDKNENQN
jgi:GntR family transcriptional regulator